MATITKSLPPLERPESSRNRSWIIYSFWAVILCLGVPTWWQTTSIPRTALPLQQMLSWSQSPDTQLTYKVPIQIAAPDLACDDAEKIVRETQFLLNQGPSRWGFETTIELVRFPKSTANGQRVGGPTCATKEVTPKMYGTSLDVELKPGTNFNLDVSSSAAPAVATYATKEMDSLPANLAESLRRALEDEQAAVAYQFRSQGSIDSSLMEFFSNMPEESQTLMRDNSARAFKPSPSYHLTFSLFTPGGYPSSWDVDSALSQYIQPLLHALTPAANFSVATQIQLYSSFSPSIQPYQGENVKEWYLKQGDLTAFVNTAEWPLSPSIGAGQTINFVLYVPSKKQTPLRVEGNKGKGLLGGSWIVPQWGGITILNAPVIRDDPEVARENVITHLTPDLLQPAFEIFQSQLLSLLGVPSSASVSLPLRLKAFQRLSALSLHLRTGSNLGSLARLAQHLNNIPIPRHVSDLVDSAMNSLGSYRNNDGKENSISAASEGYKASEKAFFDKSMVGQVYFPDEHKVAVYLPLLGPIGVPLVVGLLREIKTFMARLKS